MPNLQQNEDGSWSDATPVGLKGWTAHVEKWCWDRGLFRTARLLRRWDERNLGQ